MGTRSTEQSQRSQLERSAGGIASNSAALVTMWSGNLALFMYLCARDSGFMCVCGCGLLLCRLGQVAWFTFSSRWRQILTVCMCVCVSAHKILHFLQTVFPFLYRCLYVGYVSFWISLPFRKVCLYADMYANTHLHTHRHTRIYEANSTSCQMSRFMPTRLHINNLCSALPTPLNILYVPECCQLS